ncbi:MAG: CHRD domain-containing protein [Verrucomicrobiota bacterium]
MKRILLALLIASSVASARASIFQYIVNLNGANAGTTSLGTGTGTVIYDNVAHSLQLQVNFSGLTGTTTASHIHSPTATPFSGTAGVATTTPSFASFPLGVSSGSFANTLDLTQASSWNAAYVTANGGTTAGAEAAFASQIAAGRAYWNIHSSFAPGGEINGFLVAVPEPSSLALVGLGVFGMTARAWSQRRSKP